MNKSELEEVICQAIVEYVSSKVAERLCAYRKRALVLFTGGSLGLKQAVESLNTLRADGWNFKFLMSQSAESVLTAELIHRLCGAEEIITEADRADLKALLREYDYLIIPELTVNTAAKVACGVNDSLPTRLIAYAMAQGKRIIAATDGCCPDNPARAEIGFHVTDAYKAKLRSNLEALKSYGIHLTTAQKLAERVQRELPCLGAGAKPVLNKSSGEGGSVQQQSAAEIRQTAAERISAKPEIVVRDKHIFGRSDAWQCREADEVRVGKDVLVTPLALDELQKWNVRLIRE